MLYIKFQTSVQSGSEEEDFEKVVIYFYVLNLRTPGAGPSCTQDLQFNEIGKRSLGKCFLSNLKHLSQVVLKKNISE